MADRKISDLTALTAPASGDYLPIVDISEASAANKNKRITVEELLRGAPDGTAAAPSIGFESDGGNGMYLAGTDTVGLATNGVARVTVSTTAVSSTLAVDHPLGAVGTPSITFTGDLNTGFWSPTADTIAASTGGSERARIDSSGRLLVGTSTARSDIGSNQTANIQTESTVNGLGFFTAYNQNNAFGSVVAIAKSRGTTVGSNTIVQSGDQIGGVFFYGADGVDTATAAGIECYVDGTPGSNDMPGRLVFSTTADGASSPTERGRITSNGAWKITNNGSISSAAGTAHEIYMGTANQNVFQAVNASASPYGPLFYFSGASPDNNTNYFLNCSDTTADRLFIYSDGDVVNADNSYGGISDIKLKQDISLAGSQWNDLKSIEVTKFRFKTDVDQYGEAAPFLLGVVAQQVEAVSPGLVDTAPDRDKEGNDLGTVTKSVKYSVLYMKAVKALQEAMERIEQLESEMAEVKAQLQAS